MAGNRAEEILFLIPYMPTRPYFSSLYCECERKFRDHDELGKYRLIWRFLPYEDESFEYQVSRILKREIDNNGNFMRLLVVAPRRSWPLTEAVAEWSKQHGIPVVSVALRFQFSDPFPGKKRPPAVYTDGKQCMQKLADAAFAELKAEWGDRKDFNLVLVPGEVGRDDSDERIDGFEKCLNACCDKERVRLKVWTLQPCQWQREPAKDRFAEHLATTEGDRHVVFAANDEMALGVREAILADRSGRVSECLVYGFDGIPEVTTLINSDDGHMKGTVAQNIPQMAVKLAELIAQVLDRPGTRAIADCMIDPLDPCLPPKPQGFKKYVQENLEPFKHVDWVPPYIAARMLRTTTDNLKHRRQRTKRLNKTETYKKGNVIYVRDSQKVISRQFGKLQIYYLLESLRSGSR